MTYKLTIDQKPTYLHMIVTGRNSRENVVQYMEDVIRECTARNCGRVLIEERLEGTRLRTLDVYDIVSQGAKRFVGMLEAMAYVDVNAKGSLMHFAEDVAANRGIPVKVFSTVDEAENWLLHKDHGGTQPHAPASADKPRR